MSLPAVNQSPDQSLPSEQESAVTDTKDDSREKILRAAEQIFAEKGLAGASVRAITNVAGVNHALIGYYFGSKVALYEEVLERASTLMAAPRYERLAELREFYGSQPIPLRELLDAYIRSFFDDYGNSESLAMTWLRFYGRCFSEQNDEVTNATNRSGAPIRSHFLEELQLTLPELSKKDLVYRLGATIGTMTFWRGETGIMDDHLEADEHCEHDPDELVEEVISMCCAAFSVAPGIRTESKVTTKGNQHKSPNSITSTETMKNLEQVGGGRSRRHKKRAGSVT
jgi:AcrR family transcriptional regulator